MPCEDSPFSSSFDHPCQSKRKCLPFIRVLPSMLKCRNAHAREPLNSLVIIVFVETHRVLWFQISSKPSQWSQLHPIAKASGWKSSMMLPPAYPLYPPICIENTILILSAIHPCRPCHDWVRPTGVLQCRQSPAWQRTSIQEQQSCCVTRPL